MTVPDSVTFSNDILSFLLFDWLEVDAQVDRETLLAAIDMAERLAKTSFVPHYRQADIEETHLDAQGVRILPAARKALAEYAELGLFGTSFPEELGGFGMPVTASLAIYGIFAGANVATAAYPMLTSANARLIVDFGTPEQIEQFARPEIEGRWFGTMCLSEPQAGSSLGDIRTRASAEGEDEFGARYRVTGNKMWISGGDQDASENIVHLVLAKIAQEDGSLPAGSKGISLFIVPKILPDGRRNDLAVAGLNHKMGFRGTSNCLLNFGEHEGAIGWRVGAPGQGLGQMFTMMNEARIAVGMGASALAYRGYRQSVRYANERSQGRLVGIREGGPVPIIEHPDVRRMLLQQKVYAEGSLALCLYCAHLVDDGSEAAEALLALLTPVAKTWSSEFGVFANDLAIQVHGGYGYTRDFDVEQTYRDNRLNPIHEGTTGIQGIDLLGRKLLMSDGAPFELLRERIAETSARAGGDWARHATALSMFWDRVESTIKELRGLEGARAYDDATLFLRAFGHGVVAWLWLDQLAAAPRESPVRVGLEAACRFFFDVELPQATTWLQIVGQHSELVRGLPSEVFA